MIKEESKESTEKGKRNRDVRLFLLMVFVTGASRLPFIDNLHGGIGDSTLLATFWRGAVPTGSIVLNGISTLICGITTAFYALSIC